MKSPRRHRERGENRQMKKAFFFICIVMVGIAVSCGKSSSGTKIYTIAVIATNNFHGGEMAAEHLANLLNGKGKVMLLRYQEGVASTEARERGFIEKMKSFPGIQVISSDQYAGATRDTAKTAAENMLN